MPVKTTSVLLERYKYPVYFWSGLVIIILYILAGVGVYVVNPSYVHWFSVIFHILICLFLIYRFNPLVKAELRPYDGDIIFGCALILLFNVVVSEIGTGFLTKMFKIPMTTSTKTTP